MTKFNSVRAKFNKFLGNKKGATAIEYGLIAALVAVAIVPAVGILGTNLTATFGNVSSALTK